MQIDINEAGKTYSNKNYSLLVSAFKSLKSALGSLLADEAIDSEETTTKEQKEAATWALSDLASALGRELAEMTPNAYILDIFPQENVIVYQVGWRGGYYERSYAIDDTGVATFGDPREVSRKVSYVPTSDNDPAPAMTMTTEAASTIEIIGDQVELIERAVSDDGVTMLKLISPGVGSSGYYPAEVLKRDGPKVFKAGLHNLIDHPTAQEAAARPEGSIEKLGSTLIEDAQWKDQYLDSKGKDHGAGLYARARVVPNFVPTLNTIAGDIGVSIRASGQAKIGTVDGKPMPIIETIDQARSVDYVTLPGRGGKIISLVESANQKGNQAMAVDEKQFAELQETNRKLAEGIARLQEGQALTRADHVVRTTLATFPTLPRATRERLQLSLPGRFELSEAGTLDETKLIETVKNEVSNELAYLASLGVGQLRDLGGNVAMNESLSVADLEKQIADDLAAL